MDEAQTPSGPRWRLPSLVTIGAVLGIWYGLPGTPVQAAACERVPSAWTVPPQVCDPQFRRLPLPEATAAIDTFLSRASGAQPENAFRSLSPELQAEYPGFVEGWYPILAAMRLADIQPVDGRLNDYTVTYVTYDGEGEDVGPAAGDVRWGTQILGLREVDGQMEVDRYEPFVPDGRAWVHYVRDHRVVMGQSYASASREREVLPQVRPSTPLSLLCQLQDENGAWWSRTGWGWFPHADLALGETQRAGVPICGVSPPVVTS